MQNPRVNLTLKNDNGARLEKYCVKIVKKNGKIPPSLKQKIINAALKEWLDNHENDLDVLSI